MGTRLQEILARTRDFEKPVEFKPVKRPLQQMRVYDIHAVMPFVVDSLDLEGHYDIQIDKQWLMELSPIMTLSVLRKVKNQLMREVNEIQEEIDRIELLEMTVDDPRYGNTPWPVYYELAVKPERKRR